MLEYRLSEIEEYSSEKAVAKAVFEGARLKTLLLNLLPGQEVPRHPHPNWEVVLVPQHGEARLTRENGEQTILKAGAVYHGGIAPVFGIQNEGQEPFQTLVLLIRVEGP